MTGVAEVIGLVGAILGIAGQIISLADKAQRNREKCKNLKDHVESIKLLLEVLQNHMKPEVWLMDLLEKLNDALREGMTLVQTCQEKRFFSHVFKTQKKANKFDALDQRISSILDGFHLGNMILICTINNGLFFENVLRKLLQDGACKHLHQNVKDELKLSIKKLINTGNMSSDAQELLEWIKRDITYSDAATSGCRDASTSGSSGAQASSTGDNLMSTILVLMEQIKQTAQIHNGDEIERFVLLVQQLTNIIQHLQTSGLSLDPNTRPRLERLEQDLGEISDNIVWYSKEQNKVKRAMLCGPDNAYELLKDAYTIEYYIQVLVIALRQLYERKCI